MEKVREHAKAAAAKVKLLNSHANPIFGIDHKLWRSFEANDGKSFSVDDNADVPWLLKASESVKAWRNHADATVKPSEFGGAYKKAPTFKNECRTMAPVGPRSGKEIAEKLITEAFPCTHRPAITILPGFGVQLCLLSSAGLGYR